MPQVLSIIWCNGYNNNIVIPAQAGIQKSYENHYIYILASRRNGTLYVGATNDLIRRVYDHKNDIIEGFTKKYGIHTLVYFEILEDRESANQRERQIKEWKRRWKIRLIEKENPEWKDLYENILPSD